MTKISMTGMAARARALEEMSFQEWPEPVSFNETETPQISPNMVPEPLRTFCNEVSYSLQVPYELPVMGCLGVLAACAQGKFKVMPKPDYMEPLCLYLLTPLPPGERKSATLDACRRPLVDWEKEQARIMSPEIDRLKSERQTRQRAIDKQRAKAGNKPTEMDEIVRQVREMENELPEVPVAPRLLCDDVTPEALAEHLSNHYERAAVIEAEGGLFEILAGLYSNGRANLNLVLKSWSAEASTIDRKGRDAIRLTDPALTVCLSPQPEVLRDIASMKGFRGRGLLGRFLYCLPRSRLGRRLIETAPVPNTTEAAYRSLVLRLLETPWAKNEYDARIPHIIRLSKDAYRIWLEFAETVEIELKEGGQFEALRDWAGKLPGQAIRIAGLYHVAVSTNPAQEPLNKNTMSQALKLASVMADHARAAFSFMGSDPSIECPRKILRWIKYENISRFTARDAHQAVKGTYPKMTEVAPGLQILQERYYIRLAESENRSGAGRKPSPVFEVNPHAHNSHNSQN